MSNIWIINSLFQSGRAYQCTNQNINVYGVFARVYTCHVIKAQISLGIQTELKWMVRRY